MTNCRSKPCPRCAKEFDVPVLDLEWEPGRKEHYESAIEKLFALVHCDECVAELDADRHKGDAYRRQRAATAESYANGWVLRDTQGHTFASSRRDYEERTNDIENAFEWGRMWTPGAAKNSAYVEGTKGAGKSYFCHCVLNAAMTFGLTAREVAAGTIQDLATDFEKRNTAKRGLAEIKRAGCLLIEEAGIVNWTEYGVIALREIIDFRYRNHMPTLITSNLSKYEQRDAFDRRCTNRSIVPPMMDRMTSFVGFRFEGDSLRKHTA